MNYSTTSPNNSTGSTANIGGNQPPPKVGACDLCNRKGPIRNDLCIDCLDRMQTQRNKAFSNILNILDQDSFTEFDNFESSPRFEGGRRIIEVDSMKSAQELIRLYWKHKNKSMDLWRLHRNAKEQLSEALIKIEDQKKQIKLLGSKIDERILDL